MAAAVAVLVVAWTQLKFGLKDQTKPAPLLLTMLWSRPVAPALLLLCCCCGYCRCCCATVASYYFIVISFGCLVNVSHTVRKIYMYHCTRILSWSTGFCCSNVHALIAAYSMFLFYCHDYDLDNTPESVHQSKKVTNDCFIMS